jgi:hypothetical protein
MLHLCHTWQQHQKVCSRLHCNDAAHNNAKIHNLTLLATECCTSSTATLATEHLNPGQNSPPPQHEKHGANSINLWPQPQKSDFQTEDSESLGPIATRATINHLHPSTVPCSSHETPHTHRHTDSCWAFGSSKCEKLSNQSYHTNTNKRHKHKL